MNQQEFAPEPKGRGQQNQDRERASNYYREAANRPKEEHPSTFEDTVPPYVYHAQDSSQSSSQAEAHTRQRHTNDSPSSSGNRSYIDYQQQQPRSYQKMKGTRPQYWKNPIIRWAILILLALIVLRMLPFIAVMILSILGILAVALLLPIFIILGLIAALVIITLVVLAMLGIPIRRSSRFFHR